jgi:energy-converting hydrogenase Eha subunit E
MLIFILRALASMGLFLSIFNASIKIFGSTEFLHQYAGSSRHLDTNISTIAVCIIFLALAEILSKLDRMENK